MIDFLNIEEKLINEEVSILSQINHKEMEMLGRTSENVSCEFKTAEALSADLTLPLKIKGKMLGPGRHKLRFYKNEELIKAANKISNKKFPLKLDHRKGEAAATIGMVDNIYYDDVEGVIKYEAHINDVTHSRNVLDRAHTDVSVNIDAINYMDEESGLCGEDLDFTELSIVHDGAYQGNTLEVA